MDENVNLLVDPSYPNDLNQLMGLSVSEIDDGEFSETLLKYINQILMEEDMDDKPCMFHDPLALQHPSITVHRPVHSFNGLSPPSELHNPISNSFVGFNPCEVEVPGSNSFASTDLITMFKRGLEEGNKFLPKPNQLFIDLHNKSFPKDEGGFSLNEPRERKTHERDDMDSEGGRSRKQLAVYNVDADEETELSALFDKVLLCDRGREERKPRICKAEEANQYNYEASKFGKTRATLQDDTKEVVDLRSLILSCANAVSANDFRSANELLLQIRQHSSPLGDGCQRMAHCFANGLEARLAGTGSEIYNALASKKPTATEMLKAYQAYVSACPFKKLAIIFANIMIFKAAEKAEKLHIIDFGILYGFQWPAFIYYLSKRSGGPPKLRITGIELPQHGFRPAEQVHETGNRLARYCKRFGVPFEYDAVAKRFEHVEIEDLRIEKDEFLAVTSLLRFKNLLDETVVVNSPRDYVLKLIRQLNPAIFVHSIQSGSYTAPFFLPRFREALFNFSSFFDLADATFTREDPMRLMFEKEFVGREVINVVACEGLERVERPETYRQWQVRTMRAGFRPLPLDPVAVRKLKAKVKRGYHRDFTVEEDGNWMLQGWKGRVLYASSCWAPL